MKLDLDTTNLNWENATVRDYRYIHHLMMMIHERWTKLGMSPSGYTNSTNDSPRPCGNLEYGELAFNLHRYSPGGLLTWDQLSSIYHAMIYLGIHAYFNEKNFNEKNWKNGDNKKLYYFSLQDMCDIADFDFFSNPFIPGQPIDYYSKFLYPIKKVLSAYKKIASMHFIVAKSNAGTTPCIGTIYNSSSSKLLPCPTKIINDDEWFYQGRDKINFFANIENHINKIKELYQYYKNGGNWQGGNSSPGATDIYHLLGYEYSIETIYELWDDYGRTETSIDSGLICSACGILFGNFFKCAELWPAGIPYDIYLCHTTYYKGSMITSPTITYNVGNVPKYFNSPWPMIIHKGTYNVPNNGVVENWIELPSWNEIPKTYSHSVEGERYWEKYVMMEDNVINLERNPFYENPNWCADRYAAFYYPLLVFDVSSTFQYN
jgi:hypothetical protein